MLRRVKIKVRLLEIVFFRIQIPASSNFKVHNFGNEIRIKEMVSITRATFTEFAFFAVTSATFLFMFSRFFKL